MNNIYLPVTEIKRENAIRLVDIFLYGPYMLWFAWKDEKSSIPTRLTTGIIGLLAIVNNYINYVKVKNLSTQPNVKLKLSDYANSQSIRLLVILFTAPFMLWLGYSSKLSMQARLPMILAGVFIFFYHIRNYVYYRNASNI